MLPLRLVDSTYPVCDEYRRITAITARTRWTRSADKTVIFVSSTTSVRAGSVSADIAATKTHIAAPGREKYVSDIQLPRDFLYTRRFAANEPSARSTARECVLEHTL